MNTRLVIFELFVVIGVAACAASPASRWTASERSELKHFTASINENKKARDIAYQEPQPSSEPLEGSISQLEYQQILQHFRAALAHAQQVSDRVLDRLHPQLRRHYRTEFQRSVELQVSGIEQGDMRKQILGQMLMDNWIDWLKPHLKEFDDAIHEP